MNDRAPAQGHVSGADPRRPPIRMLVLSADPAFSEAIATCCCTLDLSVRHLRDTTQAVEALASGAAEMVVIDGGLDFAQLTDFVIRIRLTLCADWVPLIVAGDPERLRPRLRQAAPGMVDRVIGKPLAHAELHESLAAARRAVSLRRAFDSTLDRVSEAVVVIDECGLIRAFNAAAQRLFQWRHDEVLGASVNRLMPDRHLQRHDGYIARYQSTGQAQVIGKGRIESGQRRDGTQFPMHLTVSDISDSYGTRFVGVIRDLTRDREAEDLRQRALHDNLTGLPNHAYAQEQLRAACKSAAAQGDGFAVLYLDLDRFKPVNDEHGHTVGDQVLKTVAHRLRHGLERDDLVARMGGDEFLVLLRGVSRPATAEAVVRRLHDSVAQPIAVDARIVTVGMSTGIAVHGMDGTSAESLLDAADRAMYARKRLGRLGPERSASGPLPR